MDSTIIAAIIAVSGVVATAVVTLIGYIFTKRHNKRSMYAQYVSERRNTWLNEMRQYISQMLTYANSNNNLCCPKYSEARNEVMLRLNLKESYHLMLANEIKKLDNQNASNNATTKNNIIEISQKILKEEWEKVKREAKGKE